MKETDINIEKLLQKAKKKKNKKRGAVLRFWFYLVAHPILMILFISVIAHIIGIGFFYHRELLGAVGIELPKEETKVTIIDIPKIKPIEKPKIELPKKKIVKRSQIMKETAIKPNKQKPKKRPPEEKIHSNKWMSKMMNVPNYAYSEGKYTGRNVEGSLTGTVKYTDDMVIIEDIPVEKAPSGTVKKEIKLPEVKKRPSKRFDPIPKYPTSPKLSQRYISIKDLDEDVYMKPNSDVSKYIKYPEHARKAGLTGFVVLELSVSPSGSVMNAKIVHSAGYGMDEAVVDAIYKVSFKPFIIDGNAVGINDYPFRVDFGLN